MNKQRVYLNSCQILIETITLYKQLSEQKLYFIWKKGKRFSKSNVFDFEANEITSVNEKLELNLKIYQTNRKNDSKNTHLYVMVSQDKQSQGRQLCSFVLGVHEWSSNYQKIQLQIKEEGKNIGVVNMQIKKKQVMQLENFHKYNAEIEQSSDEEGSLVIVATPRNMMGTEYIQMQKQIEDLKYLNEKLKKDRTFLIARNDIVQKQIVEIKTTIKAQLTRVQEHYEKKLAIHASIYHQQIQKLITTFNENSNINALIMKSIINQNEVLSAELTQLRIISQQQLEKQQNHYKSKLAEAEDERQRLNELIADLEERGDGLERQLNQNVKNLETTREELQNITLNYGIDKKQFKGKCEEYQKQLQTQRKQISDLKNSLSQIEQQIRLANEKEEELHEQLQQKSSKLEKQLHHKVKLEAEVEGQKLLIQSLRVQKDQTIQMIKKLQADYQAYIAQGQKRNIQHQKQLQQIQMQAKDRQFQMDKQLNAERQNFFTENLKLTEANLRLEDLQKFMIVKQEQIKTLLDDNAKFNDRFLQEHQRTLQLDQHNHQLLSQVEHMKLIYETTQAKVGMLTDQLDAAYRKNQEDLQALKDQFEQSIKNRQKYYEQEIQVQRMKVENSQNSYLAMTNQYRTQLELCKKQIQKLQQDQLKLMSQNNSLTSENRKLQFQSHQYKQLHQDTKQAMRERQKIYEESLKMFLSGSSQLQQIRNSKGRRLQGANSIESDLHESLEKINLLDPNSLKTPPRNNIPQANQRNQNQYLKYVEELGSIDHIKYLKSVQQSNKDYLLQIDDLSKKYQALSIKIIQFEQQQKQKNGLISSLKIQIEKIYEENQKLHQEINFLTENDDKLFAVTSLRFQPKNQETQQYKDESFGPEGQKNFKDQSIQDSADRQQLQKSKKSRHSRTKYFTQTRQEGVQTQIYSQMSEVELLGDQENEKDSNIKKSASLKHSPSLKSSPKSPREFNELQKENSELVRKLSRAQSDYKEKSDEIKRRQQKIQRLQNRNKQLFDQLCNLKQQLGLKVSLQKSKLLQYSQMTKKDEAEYQKMKNTILQKQHQIRTTQQNFLTIKNKIVYENQQLHAQVKKLKRQVEEYQSKTKKTGGYGFSQLMQQDLEETNRKMIELNRSLNQARMQKQSAEDETRITKKRMADLQKNLIDVSDKKSIAEQQLQSVTRKFNKTKRDLTQRQEQLAKSRDQYKKMQQEITNFSALSSQTLAERKKYLQQKLEMQEQLNKKEAQIRRVHKQMQKHIQKLSQNDEYSKDRKNDKNKQLDRLQTQLIKIKKINQQFEQQIQYLNKKVATNDSQYKQKTEQMKQYFRQKLNVYVNDINEVKNILSTSDEQIRYLNHQKSALKEQLQRYMAYTEQIEDKYEKLNVQKNNLVACIQKNVQQLQQLKKQLEHYQEDSLDLHTRLATLEDQLNKQRMISVRKSQKVEQYEMLSEKYLYELKNLKVALSQHQKRQQIQNNLAAKLREFQKQNANIIQRLISINQQYQRYKVQFVFTKDQVQQLVSQLKQSYEEARKKQLADTIDELDQGYEQKNIKREKELIELYNENTKMKIEIQKKQDENSQILQRFTEIQVFPQKYRQVKDQNDGLVEEIKYLKHEDAQMRSKYQKMELQFKQFQRIIVQLKHELQIALSSFTNEKARANRLQQQALEAQTGYNIAKQQNKKLANQHSDKSQNLKSLVQTYEQKLLSVELQNTRIKERQQNMHKQYKQQIKKMQNKIKQLSSAMQEHTTTLQRQFKGRLTQKDRLLKQATRQLDSVAEDIKHLQNQVSTMKQQNDELAAQLANTRYQMSEDEEIYITEINKLKSNIKEMEDVYNYNVNQLEEELAELNRQLTMEKLSNRQREGLSTSRLRDSEVDRRLQSKLKLKDSKIEELKNNVFVLEETVVHLKKKNEGDNDAQTIPANKYRSMYNDLLQEYETNNRKHQLQRQKQQQMHKQMRKDLTKSKQNEQQLILKYDQQVLELLSVKNELKTIKQTYETLQSEIEKRQIKLTQSMSVSTTYQKQIEYKNLKIAELQDKISEIKQQNSQITIKLKSKQSEIQIINERLIVETNTINRIKNSSLDSKKVQQLRQIQSQTVRQQLELITKQNKRLYNQIDILKQDILKSKTREADLQKREGALAKQYSELLQKVYANEEIVGKYTAVNQNSLQNHGVTVEELVLGGYFDEKFFDQEQQLNQLRQDIEQMKFNQDRRSLDFEQVKKENLQLTLKMEDYQFVNEQVETLRKICDKLEQQKKIAVFRQQAIRVRLGNLINRNEARQSIKDGLQAILNYNYNVYA